MLVDGLIHINRYKYSLYKEYGFGRIDTDVQPRRQRLEKIYKDTSKSHGGHRHGKGD
jgi:hypothetical protein